MPVGYLITVVVLAWCTLFAVAPPRPRHSSPSNRSYWFGFLLNELPFLAFYWLAASTGLALSEGVADSWLGRAALAVAGVTTAGLALVAWRGFQARRAADEALDGALGPGWRGSIDPDLAGRLRRRLPLARILLLPLAVRRRSVERLANISYGDAGRWNLLDVYRHRSHPSGCPTLVYLHGGTFRSGRKNREARALLYRLASQGWLCISANYRLSPAAQFPDHLVDVKKVIAWVRGDGREYGAEPSVLFVAGSSAGGNLAAAAALTSNEPRFQPGFEHVDTSVTAAISLYGYYGRYNGSPESSPAVVRARGCAAVLRRARRPRHDRARRGRTSLRADPALDLVESGRVRRAPRRPAQLRPVRVAALRERHRRDRGVRRPDPVPPRSRLGTEPLPATVFPE